MTLSGNAVFHVSRALAMISALQSGSGNIGRAHNFVVGDSRMNGGETFSPLLNPNSPLGSLCRSYWEGLDSRLAARLGRYGGQLMAFPTAGYSSRPNMRWSLNDQARCFTIDGSQNDAYLTARAFPYVSSSFVGSIQALQSGFTAPYTGLAGGTNPGHDDGGASGQAMCAFSARHNGISDATTEAMVWYQRYYLPAAGRLVMACNGTGANLATNYGSVSATATGAAMQALRVPIAASAQINDSVSDRAVQPWISFGTNTVATSGIIGLSWGQLQHTDASANFGTNNKRGIATTPMWAAAGNSLRDYLIALTAVIKAGGTAPLALQEMILAAFDGGAGWINVWMCFEFNDSLASGGSINPDGTVNAGEASNTQAGDTTNKKTFIKLWTDAATAAGVPVDRLTFFFTGGHAQMQGGDITADASFASRIAFQPIAKAANEAVASSGATGTQRLVYFDPLLIATAAQLYSENLYSFDTISPVSIGAAHLNTMGGYATYIGWLVDSLMLAVSTATSAGKLGRVLRAARR